MYIPWHDAELFVTVAEHGSFSAAARQLRLTQPTVSRRIALLEEHLGRALFRRDSEGTHLTTDGERLLAAAQQMARWSAEMSRAASSWEDVPEGVVRCAVPPGVAFELIVPIAARARETLPGIQLEALAGVEHIDLTRGEAELAIRTRFPNQAELMVLATYRMEIGVFVAPQLAAALGDGVVSAAALPWVTWAYPLEHVAPRPQLEAAFGDAFQIGFASNDFLVLRRAVEQGLGAFVLPCVTHAESPWGPLVQVQTDLELPAFDEMHLVCARSMRHVPRVRAVADLVLDVLDEVEGIVVERFDM